jgi:hypothetical protein
MTVEQIESLEILSRSLCDWERGEEPHELRVADCGEVVFVMDEHGKREFTINGAGIVDQVM